MRVLASLLVCFLLVTPAPAVVFHDGVSNLQRTIEWITMMVEQGKSYVKTVEMVKNTYETTVGIGKMVDQGIKNISNMPKGTNILDMVTQTSNQMSSILSRVQHVGFQLDRASQQFDKLYRDSVLAQTPQGRAQMIRNMRQARLHMTGMAAQTQSIKTSFGNIFDRLSALLTAGSVSQGAKAMQQITLKQQALAQQQQQMGVAIQAVQARLETMKHAEEIMTRELLAMDTKEQTLAWLKYNRVVLGGFDGFMMQPGSVR